MAVSASDINGVKTKLVDARTTLVTMLGESDKQKQSVITFTFTLLIQCHSSNLSLQ